MVMDDLARPPVAVATTTAAIATSAAMAAVTTRPSGRPSGRRAAPGTETQGVRAATATTNVSGRTTVVAITAARTATLNVTLGWRRRPTMAKAATARTPTSTSDPSSGAMPNRALNPGMLNGDGALAEARTTSRYAANSAGPPNARVATNPATAVTIAATTARRWPWLSNQTPTT